MHILVLFCQQKLRFRQHSDSIFFQDYVVKLKYLEEIRLNNLQGGL